MRNYDISRAGDMEQIFKWTDLLNTDVISTGQVENVINLVFMLELSQGNISRDVWGTWI